MSTPMEITDDPVDQGLPPWQFFLLCGMLAATAVVIVATGQTIANIVILSLTVVATSFVGLGVYRTFVPLVSQVLGLSARVAGGRTRAALEREKALVLRSIKELEFDFAMGKVSQADFDEMGGRLRRRAMGLIIQLDASTGYREQIERDVAAQVTASATSRQEEHARVGICPACSTRNDTDARFCKQCGSSLNT
jgi:ribosomal protein L40E